MFKNPEHVYDQSVEIDEIVLDRPQIPNDYHCHCDYCRTHFLGELYNTRDDKYYSQLARNNYYPPMSDRHICPGHWQGYRWAIQQFSRPGDWILDPTVGTGTAIVEAINHGRHAIGIELEFPHITQKNIKHQYRRLFDLPEGKPVFIAGDARNLRQELDVRGFGPESVDLVLNGTPYPTMRRGKSSADAPERKNLKYREDESFNYGDARNIGLATGDEFWDLIRNMYRDCTYFLKPGGKMVILIKDMMHNKQPYLLHKYVVDEILATCPDMEYYGCYIHKHLPATLFMSTYNKIFDPNVLIPLYQTGIVLQKK